MSFFIPVGPPTIRAAMPYYDPYFGNSNMIGRPINLFPDNKYGTKILETDINGIRIRATGTENQLIKLMEELKNKKSGSNSNDESTQYRPLDELDIGPSNSTTNLNISNNNYELKLNTSTGKYELVYNNNGNYIYYEGAGLILFENLINDWSRNELAVILFRSTQTGEYEELGGHIDQGDFNGATTLLNTAIREAQEESCNLIHITDSNILNYNMPSSFIEHPYNTRVYRCYGLFLQNSYEISRNLTYNYSQNSSVLNEQNAAPVYKETNDMQRFYVNDIIPLLDSNGSITCPDVNGNFQKISGRTKNCLKVMITNKLIDIYISNPKSGRFITNNSGDWLNRTVSFVIN
jgi:hypothetical protein